MTAYEQAPATPCRLTLRFKDPALERAFLRDSLERVRLHGRTAIGVGMLVYLLCGLLDIWHVPGDALGGVWATRLTALTVPALVLLATFTPLFARFSQLLLSCVCLAAGVGLIAIQAQLPVESAHYYYPALMMLTFYTYNFIGLRFPHALAIDVALLVAYNLVCGVWLDYPPHILLGHDIFIVSSNLIGGTTGYLVEQQRRLLFLRTRELRQQRQYHLERSQHDSLTGLPNRYLLHERIEQAMAGSQGHDMRHAGCFIDLDGFKALNDRLGHEVGDRLLTQVGERLKACVRKADTVARLGGDEFFVLAIGLESERDATVLVEKLLAALREPFPDVPDDLRLHASVGVCLFPYPGMSVSGIIHHADMAMYRVKAGGKDGYHIA
ncbi:GGDEF domain-containing protein [Halomonas daqiaonensis]|uniref:Diguanylate cyclase (GGDEF) domain-containing protein n=1 Tax=Halomonas daqiaonensis TaxID=650850 RepID=A0A1H7QMU8_9GAMM|nr:GGDEF domain-containing protein [Halomonas daqiaonensis]SEL49390.1 diguanylate cyclase (GGDEF) domain-containing protein [Halomonas daqiaonensis]